MSEDKGTGCRVVKRDGKRVRVPVETSMGPDTLHVHLPTADEPAPSSDDDVWECGDEALQAQATLILIRNNKISDSAAMEKIEGLIYCAGKRFVQYDMVGDEVPW